MKGSSYCPLPTDLDRKVSLTKIGVGCAQLGEGKIPSLMVL